MTPAVLSPSRRAPRTLFALLVALLTATAVVLPAGAAHAAGASRFWGYYQLQNGAWEFATTGPDQSTPADGGVEGWRYAVASMDEPRRPRAVMTFDQICGDTPAESGKKRVGVVIDFGRPADAADGTTTPPEPKATCAVVASAATGTDVLTAVAKPRLEQAMVCGLDGYPATGCFEEVASPPAAAASPDETVSPSVAAAPAASPAGSASASAPATAVSDPAQTPTPAATSDAQPSADQPLTGAWLWITLGLIVVAGLVAAFVSMNRRRRSRD
ncbi:SCO2322 family protein [Mobilicoccus massiliensis]|uniref:SCO2322 family protein n=1 Tax=Mobilicoccus massiliensis TaxID=1522310 RepID=UPI00058B32CE|nr:SCO2322 family protein [Mobilicoccus massiliensis]